MREGLWSCDMHFKELCGSYKFQLVFGKVQGEHLVVECCGRAEWLVIEARLELRGIPITPGELVCQTVMPQSLGPAARWPQLLQEQIDIGYNSFHFPPVLTLGKSGSHYSISNHTQPNPRLFGSMAELASTIRSVKERGALCFTDLVLNHVSFDAEQLEAFRQGLYTTERRAELAATLEVEQVLNRLGEKAKPAFLKGATPALLASFLEEVRAELEAARYWEYFRLHEDCFQKMFEAVPPTVSTFNIF